MKHMTALLVALGLLLALGLPAWAANGTEVPPSPVAIQSAAPAESIIPLAGAPVEEEEEPEDPAVQRWRIRIWVLIGIFGLGALIFFIRAYRKTKRFRKENPY